jgi:hypothetical protein
MGYPNSHHGGYNLTTTTTTTTTCHPCIVHTFAMIAGGLEVMKSKASPLKPIPSLSTRNIGKLETGE